MGRLGDEEFANIAFYQQIGLEYLDFIDESEQPFKIYMSWWHKQELNALDLENKGRRKKGNLLALCIGLPYNNDEVVQIRKCAIGMKLRQLGGEVQEERKKKNGKIILKYSL